jgi:hypothetical protein
MLVFGLEDPRRSGSENGVTGCGVRSAVEAAAAALGYSTLLALGSLAMVS